MESLAQFIAPILSLWVIHNAIFSSARFVNNMRETVISGFHDGKPITPEHRKVIRQDWGLCIAATILVCAIFAVLVFFVGRDILEGKGMGWVAVAIALYPAGCAFGFALCSLWDYRLMKDVEQAGWPKAPDSTQITS